MLNSRIVSCLIALLVSSTGISQQAAIEWLTWEEAIAKQQEAPRKIFIDLYTDWCGWCKKMDASTFKDPSIAAAMNQYYYAVKFDAERKDTIVFDGHTFYNLNPQSKRGVHTLAASLLDNQLSYPSFVVLDENFNRVHLIKGYQQVPNLAGLLLFFGTNQHLGYQKYVQYQQAKAAAQQQQPQQQSGTTN